MRICTQLAFAAATAGFAAFASAAPAPGAVSTDHAANAMMTVQTIAGAVNRLPTPDAAALAGSYQMSNGEVVRVSYEQRRLYAELGARKSELVPAGGSSYAARGTGMVLTFDQAPFVTDLVVSTR